jgi:hypothetical protein
MGQREHGPTGNTGQQVRQVSLDRQANAEWLVGVLIRTHYVFPALAKGDIFSYIAYLDT